MRGKKVKTKIIRRCPICKSKELDYMVWLGQKYRCRKCKWFGVLALEEDKQKSKIKKKTNI